MCRCCGFTATMLQKRHDFAITVISITSKGRKCYAKKEPVRDRLLIVQQRCYLELFREAHAELAGIVAHDDQYVVIQIQDRIFIAFVRYVAAV